MKRVCKGSITVYLSLMLAVMITVTSVCLESAHQEAVEAELAMKSEEAGMNLLSHFERKLYEKYDLLALNNRLDGNGIMTASFSDREELFHLNYQVDQASMQDIHYLGDENGKGFQLEVNEIMTEEAIKKIKKEISSYLKKAKEGETVTSHLESSSASQGNLTELFNLFSELNEGCKSLNRVASVMYDALDSYYDAAKNYKTGDMTFGNATFQNRKQLKVNEERLLTLIEELLKKIHRYKQLALEVSYDSKTVEEALSDDSLSKEEKDLLYEQVQSIKDMSKENGDSYKKVISLEEKLVAYKSELEKSSYPELSLLMEEVKSDRGINSLFEPGLSLLTKLKELKLAEEKATDYSRDGASIKQLLNTVKDIMKEGPYAYIIGETDKLSNREVEMKEMPSTVYKKKSSEDTEHILKRVVVESADACAMNCYLTQYMGCYTDSDTYDLEYILGGKDTDQKNLKVVINQLVLFRSTMNLVYLISDKGKREEAEAAALMVSTLVGMPALEKVASYVILSAWAYGEAVMDVKALVKGGKIPFLKKAKHWKLSLTSTEDVKSRLQKSSETKEGLTYKEYLRLMLFFHSRCRNLYRGLDMIQWNLCKSDSGFRISQCIYETGLEIQAKIPYLFISESFAGRYSSETKQISLSRKVGYCSIDWPST